MSRTSRHTFIIPPDVKLSVAQNQALGRLGVRHGQIFTVSNEGGAVISESRRKKLKTVSNVGSVHPSSVRLCSVWLVDTEKVRFTLSFKYSAMEEMDLKVFFAAKDMHSTISLRKQLQGTKKWEDVVLPPGTDAHWDSAEAGLFLESNDPVFMRVLRGAGKTEDAIGLYDMIIVISPRHVAQSRESHRPASAPLPMQSLEMNSRGYGPVATADGDADNPGTGTTSFSSRSRSESFTRRWEEAKRGMLRGLQGLSSVVSPVNLPGEAGAGSDCASNDTDKSIEPVRILCEKTRFQLQEVAPGWKGPSDSDRVRGDGKRITGPSVPIECAAQVVQLDQVDYVVKDVYGGQWKMLAPSAPAANAVALYIEDGGAGGEEENELVEMEKEKQIDFDAEDYQDTYCVICMSEPREVVVHPCNHCCCCLQCASVLSSIQGQLDRNRHRSVQDAVRCPMCRVIVTAMVHLIKPDEAKRLSSTPTKGL